MEEGVVRVGEAAEGDEEMTPRWKREKEEPIIGRTDPR